IYCKTAGQISPYNSHPALDRGRSKSDHDANPRRATPGRNVNGIRILTARRHTHVALMRDCACAFDPDDPDTRIAEPGEAQANPTRAQSRDSEATVGYHVAAPLSRGQVARKGVSAIA